jgi:cation transport ATPase
MHDVNKNLFAKGSEKKKAINHSAHSHENMHEHEHNHDEHLHEDGHDHDHEHDHPIPHGHDHHHDENEYEVHDQDLHTHEHGHMHQEIEDRAFAHLHEHGHDFSHAHHHTHHPEHAGIVHKVFGDPLRDWFAAFLMGFLIVAGYLKWLPGYLSGGMLVCAAVIGIFPAMKNGLFNIIIRRRLSFELLVGVLLLVGLFTGRFLEIALISLFLLVGSFMRLNFSWKD